MTALVDNTTGVRLGVTDPESVNRNAPLPIYQQIADALRGDITAGALRPGDDIPSETLLADRLNVSRMTVRQAIADLVAQGLLVRRRGVGTFVNDAKRRHDVQTLCSFSEEMAQRGLKVSSQVMHAQRQVPDTAASGFLHLKDGEKVFQICRLRFVEDEPMAVETVHVPCELFEGLLEHDLAGSSLFAIYEQHYGMTIGTTEHRIEPVNAAAAQAKLLGVSTGTALLRMTGGTYTTSARPIEYVEGLYRGDRYGFRMTLSRRRGSTAKGLA